MGWLSKLLGEAKQIIDMSGYGDETHNGCYPICSECLVKMEYNSKNDTFKCPNCGRLSDEDEDEFMDDDDDIPEGCIACGGPYPDCTISCKLFDD